MKKPQKMIIGFKNAALCPKLLFRLKNDKFLRNQMFEKLRVFSSFVEQVQKLSKRQNAVLLQKSIWAFQNAVLQKQ